MFRRLDVPDLCKKQVLPSSLISLDLQFRRLPAIMVTVIFAAISPNAYAEEDLPSTPRELSGDELLLEELLPEEEPPSRFEDRAPVTSLVTIGLDFEASRLFNPVASGGSGFIPPDTMGAVGPDHIVEMINGNFEIFDKTNGTSISSRSLDDF
jgi:hypothetical protein